MSQTHTGLRLAANKFRIRMRVGSASALNHRAYSRARPRPSFGDVAVRQHTVSLSSSGFRLRANGRVSFVSFENLTYSSKNINEWSRSQQPRGSAGLCKGVIAKA